ncbi:type II/IV secretion system ATPase TadZ/CpaE, associated with Flp pilus assembly [Geomicrobium sp. JCM 19037]|nr:hypothetical protein [Geomicrobium sp. JCM 19037]GAK06090.1 type II/IV secretion system ATPase TadZ/CpaE, associated with Flp pilus assembly [Geomicrobium sp. JCM 19037]
MLLIDLNVQYGGQEVLLGLESVRTYIDLKPVLRELDIHHIHNITAHNEASNLDVLLSPCQPEQAEELTDDLISALIRTARTHYDYVILDIPSDINDTSFTALNESTEIYYILTPDSLSLRSYRHAMNLFERLNLERFENVHILLNQEHDKSELTNKDISNLIDRKIAGNFHSDYLKLQPYINLGEPVFTSEKKAKFKLAKDVSGFVKRQLLTAKKEGDDSCLGFKKQPIRVEYQTGKTSIFVRIRWNDGFVIIKIV